MREKSLHWFFAPETDRWLSILRIGLAIQIFLYLFSIRGDWAYLLAGTGHGLVSRDLAEALLSLESPFIPRLGWLVAAGKEAGLNEATVLDLSWYGLVLAALFLLVGLFSRAAAVMSWGLHLCSIKSGGLLSYGVDALTTTGLFYLMLSPLPDRLSLDHAWRNKLSNPDLLRFWRRVVQLHLCLIYFFSGLSKALGRDWWNGINFWRSLIRPPFDFVSPKVLLHFQFLFPAIGISVFMLEIGYPFFVWSKHTRTTWLAAVIAMHIGIGLFMGMYLFASIMIILNLAAFGPGVLWRAEVEPAQDGDLSLPAATA